jgi:hypothetical protein
MRRLNIAINRGGTYLFKIGANVFRVFFPNIPMVVSFADWTREVIGTFLLSAYPEMRYRVTV